MKNRIDRVEDKERKGSWDGMLQEYGKNEVRSTGQDMVGSSHV